MIVNVVVFAVEQLYLFDLRVGGYAGLLTVGELEVVICHAGNTILLNIFCGVEVTVSVTMLK